MPVVASKYKLVPLPQNYQDITDPQTLRRLNADLKKIVNTLNAGIPIQVMPKPTNLQGMFLSGYVVLSWDDVADTLRKDLDGARIWKAAAADDPDTDFNGNNAKQLLVSCSRTTKFLDVELVVGDYIYWVQWINREGIVSSAAGGLVGTII